MNLDVEVQITLLPTEDGGRKSPIMNGFRSPIQIVPDKLNDVLGFLYDADGIRITIT